MGWPVSLVTSDTDDEDKKVPTGDSYLTDMASEDFVRDVFSS
jgi:hypothetical protein